jgi:hypothetical protein
MRRVESSSETLSQLQLVYPPLFTSLDEFIAPGSIRFGLNAAGFRSVMLPECHVEGWIDTAPGGSVRALTHPSRFFDAISCMSPPHYRKPVLA